MININLFKAGYGDTILVAIGQEDTPELNVNILIDCGFHFASAAVPVLSEMHGSRINLFVITHYDSDHINGAAKFITENGSHEKPLIIPIDEVWLNTFRHIQFEKNSATLDQEAREKLDDYIRGLPKPEPVTEGPIGARQASLLGAKLLEFGYPWNVSVNGEAVFTDKWRQVSISDEVSLILLGPTKARLVDLQQDFIKQLEKLNVPVTSDQLIDDAYELFVQAKETPKVTLTEKPISSSHTIIDGALIREMSKDPLLGSDDSAANASSIAFILMAEGNKVLFMGDANPKDIAASLRCLYPKCVDVPVVFDAIKVSHHGSLRNSSPELFSLMDSPRYLFSTNGKHPKHSHPDLQTIALIINRPLQPGIAVRELVFNYKLDLVEKLTNDALQKEFNYSITISTDIQI